MKETMPWEDFALPPPPEKTKKAAGNDALEKVEIELRIEEIRQRMMQADERHKAWMKFLEQKSKAPAPAGGLKKSDDE